MLERISDYVAKRRPDLVGLPIDEAILRAFEEERTEVGTLRLALEDAARSGLAEGLGVAVHPDLPEAHALAVGFLTQTMNAIRRGDEMARDRGTVLLTSSQRLRARMEELVLGILDGQNLTRGVLEEFVRAAALLVGHQSSDSPPVQMAGVHGPESAGFSSAELSKVKAEIEAKLSAAGRSFVDRVNGKPSKK